MIDKELLKQLRKIEIRTQHLADEQLAGNYHSVFKGRRMDFDEVQPYHDGDDVRFIDWNVSARTGALHIKHFVEERELTVQILVDTSSSMAFGTGEESKRVIAAQIASVLAVLAIKNNDRVGLALFDDEVDLYIPPKKGKKHVLNLVTQILEHQPRRSTTDIAAALQYITRVTKRRAVVFVVSDFLTAGYEDSLSIVARRHDVIPVLVEDRREQTLVPRTRSAWGRLQRFLFGAGVIGVEDLESGRRADLDLGSRWHQDGFAERVEAHDLERRRVFNRLRLDTIRFSADEAGELDYVKPLASFFRRRTRRH